MTTRIEQSEYKFPTITKVTAISSALATFVGSIALGVLFNFSLGTLAVPVAISGSVLILVGLSLAAVTGYLFYKSLGKQNSPLPPKPKAPAPRSAPPATVPSKSTPIAQAVAPSSGKTVSVDRKIQIQSDQISFQQFIENYTPPILRINDNIGTCQLILKPDLYDPQVGSLRKKITELKSQLDEILSTSTNDTSRLQEANALKREIISNYLTSSESSPIEITFLEQCSLSQISALAKKWIDATEKKITLAYLAEIEAQIGLTTVHSTHKISDPQLIDRIIGTKDGKQKTSNHTAPTGTNELGQDQIQKNSDLQKFLKEISSKTSFEERDLNIFLGYFIHPVVMVGNSLSAAIELGKKVQSNELWQLQEKLHLRLRELVQLSFEKNSNTPRPKGSAEEIRNELIESLLGHDEESNKLIRNFLTRISLQQFFSIFSEIVGQLDKTAAIILERALLGQAVVGYQDTLPLFQRLLMNWRRSNHNS